MADLASSVQKNEDLHVLVNQLEGSAMASLAEAREDQFLGAVFVLMCTSKTILAAPAVPCQLS